MLLISPNLITSNQYLGCHLFFSKLTIFLKNQTQGIIYDVDSSSRKKVTELVCIDIYKVITMNPKINR